MSDMVLQIAENLQAIRDRIAAAAGAAGRRPEEITLVGITKYTGIEEAQALIEAGCLDLGESRPQELWHKSEAITDPQVRWHLVGHLQRNKIRRTLKVTHLIHSVDSLRLLSGIDEESAVADRRTAVLLEVNISGDAAKHGFSPDEMPAVLEEAEKYSHVEVRGLMGMASLEGDLAAAQKDFARLRQLRDSLRPCCSGNVCLDELSMGMSGDLEAAIAEGATIVRVGSALFEGLLS